MSLWLKLFRFALMLALILAGHALMFTFIHISHIQEENELGVEQNAEGTEPTEDEDFEKMVDDVLVLPTPQEFQMPVSPFLVRFQVAVIDCCP